jgi:hypothetical protein
MTSSFFYLADRQKVEMNRGSIILESRLSNFLLSTEILKNINRIATYIKNEWREEEEMHPTWRACMDSNSWHAPLIATFYCLQKPMDLTRTPKGNNHEKCALCTHTYRGWKNRSSNLTRTAYGNILPYYIFNTWQGKKYTQYLTK